MSVNNNNHSSAVASSATAAAAANGNIVGLRRLSGRDSFRHLHQKQGGPTAAKSDNLNIDNCYLLKGQMRR